MCFGKACVMGLIITNGNCGFDDVGVYKEKQKKTKTGKNRFLNSLG